MKAMKDGDWILLDELNLAPQTVLEGLNSCFDHRQRVFIPEIGQAIDRPASFRIFCTQNPMAEGGGRKGLPQSFLSRLTRVFVQPLTDSDLVDIAQTAFQNQSLDCFLNEIPQMVTFIRELQDSIVKRAQFGVVGAPWEFNIRDIMRWCELLDRDMSLLQHEITDKRSTDWDRKIAKIFSESCYLLCKPHN